MKRGFYAVGCGLLGCALILAWGCGGKKTGPTVDEANQAMAAAQAAYQNLMELNPPQTLEYQARVLLKQAEELLASKQYSEAKARADQARTQADLATQAREKMIAETKPGLERSRAELELMYFPSVTLIRMYWDAMDKLAQKDYDEARRSADQLELLVAKEKQLSFTPSRMMTVLASDEDLRRYGWPRLYEEVRTDCSLANVVDTVEPLKQVKYIRMVLCSPKATFYLVESPKSGKQGWLAERYVSQARAESH